MHGPKVTRLELTVSLKFQGLPGPSIVVPSPNQKKHTKPTPKGTTLEGLGRALTAGFEACCTAPLARDWCGLFRKVWKVFVQWMGWSVNYTEQLMIAMSLVNF